MYTTSLVCFMGSAVAMVVAAKARNQKNNERRGRDAPDLSLDYDCVVIGAGLSGLNTVHSLIKKHKMDPSKILLLEAQSYIGGRVMQTDSFVKGMTIDLGAEIIHGTNTLLTEYAKEMGESITPIFVWAQGDGGPMEAPVHGAYVF
jgi:monoamine oxidase